MGWWWLGNIGQKWLTSRSFYQVLGYLCRLQWANRHFWKGGHEGLALKGWLDLDVVGSSKRSWEICAESQALNLKGTVHQKYKFCLHLFSLMLLKTCTLFLYFKMFSEITVVLFPSIYTTNTIIFSFFFKKVIYTKFYMYYQNICIIYIIWTNICIICI